MSPKFRRLATLRKRSESGGFRGTIAAMLALFVTSVATAQNAVPVPPLPVAEGSADSPLTTTAPAATPAPDPLPPSAPKPPHIVVPQDIQVVSIQTPDGVGKTILGPEPAFKFATGDSPEGHLLTGLKVGSTTIVQFPEPQGRTGRNIYASIEIYGHLHRPSDVDPLRFPLRVTLSDDDIESVLDQGRMITRVIYLEDPRQAIPYLSMPDRLPTTELGPGEDPFRIARALGRIMAVVRIGTREPTAEEVNMLGVSRLPLTGARCLYVSRTGEGCRMSCPTVTCAPAPVAESCKPPKQPGMPMDEYLCDGGDDGRLASSTPGSSMGIEPQDAVIQFGIGQGPGSRRMLPTNIVCIYAPRFAATEIRTGANENILVQGPYVKRNAQLMEALRNRELGVKLTRIDPPITNRMTQRASGIINRQAADTKIELRVLGEFEIVDAVKAHDFPIRPQGILTPVKAMSAREAVGPVAIKTAESVVVTGIEQSASEKVMTWTPHEQVGSEPVPDIPGLAVIKRVSADEAMPGEKVEFVIQFRNMGNVPIRAVSVVDSLLPRLEYVKGSARGPKGTVFTANSNVAGSTELRWDLPGSIAPGDSGYVSFEAVVR